MTAILTTELIERCHAGSKAKGFWDVIPPQGQQLMLVISELAEALEAHRKGHRTMPGCVEGTVNTLANCPEYFETRFQANIKDTVEDELADAYIRLCDFIGGYGLSASDVIAAKNEWAGIFGGAGSCFAEALLPITHTICSAWTDDVDTEIPIGYAMHEIEVLAEREGIDMATHIDLKLRYNATRPAKHGKAY